MVELGLFGEDERVELLYGQLVAMSPIGARHNWSVQELNRLLMLALHRRAIVRVQSSIAASDISEPQPDVAVLPKGNYLEVHPARAILVIEVADTSLRADRRVKGPLYAAMGVPEYWIVNLLGGVLEVYREPGARGYGISKRHRRGGTVSPLAFPDVKLAVSDFVPPRSGRKK